MILQNSMTKTCSLAEYNVAGLPALWSKRKLDPIAKSIYGMGKESYAVTLYQVIESSHF
jgi:hypothetical protein